MFTFLGLVTITALLILSAFWSGSETALTSLSKYRVKRLIVTNKSLSGVLGQWLKSPYYILTAILVGNTLTNLLISALATVIVLRTFSQISDQVLEALQAGCARVATGNAGAILDEWQARLDVRKSTETA